MVKNLINYVVKYKESNLNIVGRSEVDSDSAIISMIFQSFMFATERFPTHHASLLKYFANLKLENYIPTIIDAGANIGVASLFFSLQFEGSKIYSIEPDKENFNILSLNMVSKNFVGLHGALGSIDGITYLNTKEFDPIAYRTGDVGDIEVETFGLSNLKKNLPENEIPFILKIDIEGAETEVFSVDSSFLSQVPLIIMEPHDWMIPFKASSKNFYAEISKHNFDILMFDENIFCFNVDILNAPN